MHLYESCEKVWIKGRKDGCIESKGNGMLQLSEFNLMLKRTDAMARVAQHNDVNDFIYKKHWHGGR